MKEEKKTFLEWRETIERFYDGPLPRWYRNNEMMLLRYEEYRTADEPREWGGRHVQALGH